MKSRSRVIQISFAGLTVAAVCAAAACSTTDAGDDSAAGSGGTSSGTAGTGNTSAGGSSSVAGASSGVAGSTTGTAGTGSSTAGSGAGGGAGPMGTLCPTPTSPKLFDFTPVDGGNTTSFGDFSTMFSGSLYAYPNALTADATMGNYHLTGMVADYSGIGIAINMCNEVDLSAYDGITFTVSGSVAAAGTAANTITLIVGTAADDIESSWLNAQNAKADAGAMAVADSFGRCIPKSMQYDGTCASPQYVVKVTDTATPVTVKWADLTGGAPSKSVNPKEITSIGWVIPPPAGAGTPSPTPYALDLTLDDIAFTTAP